MPNYIPEIGDLVIIKQKKHDGYYLEKYEEFKALIINVNRRLFQVGDGAYLTPQQQNLLKTFEVDPHDGDNFITIKKLFEKLIIFAEQKKNRFIFITEVTYMKNAEVIVVNLYSTLDNLVSIDRDNFAIKCIKSNCKNSDKLKHINKFINSVPKLLMNSAKKRIEFLIFLQNLNRNEFSDISISNIQNELFDYENFVEHYEAIKLNRSFKMDKSRMNKFDHRKAETIKKKYGQSYSLESL